MFFRKAFPIVFHAVYDSFGIAKKRNAKEKDCHVLEKGKEVTRTSSGTYNDSPDGRSAIKSCGRN